MGSFMGPLKKQGTSLLFTFQRQNPIAWPTPTATKESSCVPGRRGKEHEGLSLMLQTYVSILGTTRAQGA